MKVLNEMLDSSYVVVPLPGAESFFLFNMLSRQVEDCIQPEDNDMADFMQLNVSSHVIHFEAR
jgi:hypothetical protein